MARIKSISAPLLRFLTAIGLLTLIGCEKAPAPEDAAGSQLVVASWGGAYQDAQRKAFFEPFSKETGVEIVEVSTPDIATFYEWHQAGRAGADVVDVETSGMLQAARNGLLHPIDFATVDTTGLMSSAIDEFGVATVTYAVVMAWNSETNPAWENVTWADFWNVEDYSGARGLRDLPASTFEAALLGAGVDADEVYPLDPTSALNSLDALRRETRIVLWETGSQPVEWLLAGEVTLTTAWNGRVHNARLEGKPVAMTFDGGIIDRLWWVIPENAPHSDVAQRFIAFTLRPDRQAELARLIPYGPTNQIALEQLDDETLADLPTSPENLSRMIVLDNQWWSSHGDEVQTRWEEWKVGTGPVSGD